MASMVGGSVIERRRSSPSIGSRSKRRPNSTRVEFGRQGGVTAGLVPQLLPLGARRTTRQRNQRHNETMRTGPLGRAARLVLVALLIESFVSIADQGGPASFRGARNLTEPSLLVLDALMLALFVSMVGVVATSLRPRAPTERWSLATLAVAGAAVALAAALSQVAHGTIWDSPLSDLVWWFDALMLLETIVTLVVAVAIGLPGCEIGVWPWLIARSRGEPAPLRAVGCIVGLHLIDNWEASRGEAHR